MRGLKGKIAVVTGGCNGLGAASARRLIEEGCRVAILDLQEPDDGLRAELGDAARFYRADIGDETQIASAIEAARGELGDAAILVNNAALFVFRGVEATSAEWEQVCRVNIAGTSLVTQHVLPQMERLGSGSIINLSSVSGFVGQANFTTYNATKFAIRGLTKCWAIDLAPRNIRVNAICPGYIYTAAFESYCEKFGVDIEEEDRRVGAQHLLNRQGRPEEIGAAVAFLASDDASFMTGSDLVVDGGYLAR